MDYRINLQLFAEEKTEPATPKRRREAREKGQVARSREMVTSLMLLIAFWSLRLLSKGIYRDLSAAAARFLNFSKDMDDAYKTENLMRTLLYCMFIVLKVAGPILLIIAAVAFAGNYLQIGFLFTTKPLVPNLNKINPIEGFKRLFSKQAAVEFLKSIFKIGIIGYMVYDYLRDNYNMIPKLIGMDVMSTAAFIGNTIVNVGMRAAAVLLIMSIFDYAYQFWDFEVNLRMSKKEIKEEYKQTEGNPQIKSKIREKQRMLSLRRMMAEVPKSDVVITNPTHYAIAVKYDPEASEAPVVIAKGKDLIAQKIKDTARDHKVPVVENKPLAQALYKSAEIGDKIPAELYKAVAEVLAFVYSLKGK